MVNPLSSGGVKMTIINKKNYIPNGSLIYHTDGSATNHQGFTINHLDGMKASTEYMVSFKAKVILGQVKSIGVLKKINHTTGEILLDNVKLSDFNTHTAVTNTTINNGEFHEILITFTTAASPALVSDNISDVNVLGDVFFVNYDQPAECSIEIKDLKWEVKGDYPTKWSRPPEDLTVPFEMIDAYTKDETDHLLDNKANVVDVYTKTDSYNKEEVDKLIEDVTGSIGGGGSGGGSSVDAYTKVEVDEKLKNYLPLTADEIITSNIMWLKLKTAFFEVYSESDNTLIFSADINTVEAYKPLLIYDGLYISAKGKGRINVAKLHENILLLGSSLLPTIIESNGPLLVKNSANGESEKVLTEPVLDETVSQIAMKFGSSNVNFNDSDYGDKVHAAFHARRYNETIKITSEQLNTIPLVSGVYILNGYLTDTNGRLVLDDSGTVFVRSYSDSSINSVVSEQVVYSDDINRPIAISRIMKYIWNNTTKKYDVSAIRDWSYSDRVPIGSEFSRFRECHIGFYNVTKGQINTSVSASSDTWFGEWNKPIELVRYFGVFKDLVEISGSDICFKKTGIYRIKVNIAIGTTEQIVIPNGVYVAASITSSLGNSVAANGPHLLIGRTNIGGSYLTNMYENSYDNIYAVSVEGEATFDINDTNIKVQLSVGLCGKVSTPLTMLNVVPRKPHNNARRHDVSIEYLGTLTAV